MTTRQLTDLVERTISALENARLPLDMPGSRELSQSRIQLLTQLKTRILPHLTTAQLPAVVVFGGSSGAGKSTLFNTLVNKEISPASVLRPTTRTPVIAVHPMNGEALEGHALLEMGRLEVLPEAIPGIALVDAPDLDSVDAANREISHRLLDAADLWVFVTTAARYGDASAWRTLQSAYERGTRVAVVLNRVPARSQDKIRDDLKRRMAEIGITDAPLMLVEDAGPHEGLLPRDSVYSVRLWLLDIARDNVADTLVDETTRATLPALHGQLVELAEAVELQANSVQDLKDRASVASVQPTSKLTTNATNGRYGQGAPTTSWLSYASTGGALASLAAGEAPGFFAKRQKGQRDAAMTAVFDAVVSAIHVALRQGVASTDTAISDSWREDIVDTTTFRAEGHRNVDSSAIVEGALRAWKADLVELTKGSDDNPWLGRPGLAALLGSAAGGVSGAQKALNTVGLSSALRPARTKLLEHLEEAMRDVVAAYTHVLDGIDVGNGRQLRVRASEYVDRI
ncbi:50S ribosome-binding GTPase [Arcanobacterium haemolyticum]|nr:50S ribosome-binding GTPase [Arcanobacterium haemolyticum]